MGFSQICTSVGKSEQIVEIGLRSRECGLANQAKIIIDDHFINAPLVVELNFNFGC